VTVRRGTTNRNDRGSAAGRRARKLYLFATYGNEGIVTCYRCDVPMLPEDCTTDRIVPGCQGGTYARYNIRPACGPCNSETGARLAGHPEKALVVG
jgi:hypothetical protein